MKKELTKSQQGKKNKRDGAKFELLVRKDLESKGWVVAKWMNQVEIIKSLQINFDIAIQEAKLIPAKHKFCGFGRPMAIGTGYPDFICFKTYKVDALVSQIYEVIGVEAKSNGYLDKEEKAKCEWLLKNNIFSKILIAKKEEKGVVYEEYGTR
jgi:hypothetical protein